MDNNRAASAAAQEQLQEMMHAFWQNQYADIEKQPIDWKVHQLPLVTKLSFWRHVHYKSLELISYLDS